MARGGTFELLTAVDLSGLRSGLSSADSELRGFAEKSSQDFQRRAADMMRVGSRLSLAVTVPLVAMSTAVLNVAGGFEQSMNTVSALTQATGKDFDELTASARELGATTVFSASEAADGMSFLARAGLETNEIIGAMPATLLLASSAQLDLAQSADIVTNIMAGYSIEVEDLGHTVDVLTKAFVSSNTDLGQLGDAMKFVGPVASGFGIQFEEAAAAVGALSDAGIQGSMAGTTLRGILTRLDDAGKKWGITVRDVNGDMLPFVDILEQIEEQGVSSTEVMEIFGDRAGPGMLTLISQGSVALREFTGELEQAGGTAKAISDKQLEGFRGKVVELKSAVEGLLISLGDTGLLGLATKLAEGLTSLVRRIDAMPAPVKAAGVALAGVAAVAGPLLITFGGIVRVLPLVTSGFVALGTVVSLASGPVGWLTLAAGAAWLLGSRFLGAKDASDELTRGLESIERGSNGTRAALERLDEAVGQEQLLGSIQELAVYLDEDAAAAFKSAATAAVSASEDIEGAAQGIAAAYNEAARAGIVAQMAIMQAKIVRLAAEAEAEEENVKAAAALMESLGEQRSGLLLRQAVLDPYSMEGMAVSEELARIEMQIRDLAGISNHSASNELAVLTEGYRTLGEQLGFLGSSGRDLPGALAGSAGAGSGVNELGEELGDASDAAGELEGGLEGVASGAQTAASAVDEYAEALKDAVVWSDRLVEEVGLGLKTPAEALALLEPRQAELQRERRDIVAAGGFGSFEHDVAVGKDEIITAAVRAILRQPGAVNLDPSILAEFISPYEELIMRGLEEAFAQDAGEARHARGVELFNKRVADDQQKAIEYAEYVAELTSPERIAAMIAAEVDGPSAGMAGSGRSNYLIREAIRQSSTRDLGIDVGVDDFVSRALPAPSVSASIGRVVPLAPPVVSGGFDLSGTLAGLDEDIRLAGEEFRYAVTQSERDAASERIDALNAQRDEMVGAARSSGQEFANYVESAGMSLIGLFESIQSGSASGVISGIGGFASSVMGAIGGDSISNILPWVGVATSLIGGIAGLVQGSGRADEQAREQQRAAGAQARGVSSFSINVQFNSALQVASLTDQASRSAIRSYEEGLAERMLGAIERSLIPRIQNLENAVGI